MLNSNFIYATFDYWKKTDKHKEVGFAWKIHRPNSNKEGFIHRKIESSYFHLNP